MKLTQNSQRIAFQSVLQLEVPGRAFGHVVRVTVGPSETETNQMAKRLDPDSYLAQTVVRAGLVEGSLYMWEAQKATHYEINKALENQGLELETEYAGKMKEGKLSWYPSSPFADPYVDPYDDFGEEEEIDDYEEIGV